MAGALRVASRTHSTRNSVGRRFRYRQMRSKLVSDAHRASAEATAYSAAAFSGTGSWVGFNRIVSMLGNPRNIRRTAENSVAAPVPTAPAMTSCSIAGFDCESRESRMRETNSHERGDGKALASRSNALNSG